MSTPPGPTTRSPFGHLFSFAPNPLKFLQKLSDEYGDIASFRIRNRPVFFLSRPDLIQDVLVTRQRGFVKNPGFQNIRRILGDGLLSSEGDFHLRQRRLIQPTFRRDRVAAYGDIVSEHAALTRDRWQDGTRIDMSAEMARLTLAIVGKAFFNADVDDEASDISQALADAMTLFSGMSSPSSLIMDRIPVLNRRFRKGQERLDEAVYRIIDARRSGASEGHDVLATLLQAQDEEGNGGGMTDRQVRDEALTLLLAGHETSAVALTWTLYLLARHPSVAEVLRAEIDEVLGDRLPSAADLEKLAYTRMVLSESMRLYPPVYMIGRQALEDFPAADYVIPAGCSLIMSQYITQRDGRFFPEPERFDPERWSEEQMIKRPKFSYFPFGGGVRVCIGEPFAWLEMILVIATLCQRWRFQIDPKQMVELEPRVTLRPKGGMPLAVRQRHN